MPAAPDTKSVEHCRALEFGKFRVVCVVDNLEHDPVAFLAGHTLNDLVPRIALEHFENVCTLVRALTDDSGLLMVFLDHIHKVMEYGPGIMRTDWRFTQN